MAGAQVRRRVADLREVSRGAPGPIARSRSVQVTGSRPAPQALDDKVTPVTGR